MIVRFVARLTYAPLQLAPNRAYFRRTFARRKQLARMRKVDLRVARNLTAKIVSASSRPNARRESVAKG
jgi:hypothetical protein